MKKISEKQLKEIVSKSVNKVLEEFKGYPTPQEWNFNIVSFTPSDNEWNEYIKPNRKEIWNFLNDGYKYAGYNGFEGCYGSKELIKNASLIKIAFYKNVWVAISVYTSYLGGLKCVGITSTTDKYLRKIGVNAVHQLVQLDIDSYKEFYWTECSGSLEKMYEKYGGIKIPSSISIPIIGKEAKASLTDEFHFKRKIKGDWIEKVMYGFNNPNTFAKVEKEFSDYLDGCLKNIESRRINEESERIDPFQFNQWQYAKAVIDVVVLTMWEERIFEYPIKYLELVKENVNFLISEVKEKKCPSELVKMMGMAIMNGKTALQNAIPMECHKMDRFADAIVNEGI